MQFVRVSSLATFRYLPSRVILVSRNLLAAAKHCSHILVAVLALLKVQPVYVATGDSGPKPLKVSGGACCCRLLLMQECLCLLLVERQFIFRLHLFVLRLLLLSLL